MYRRISPYLLLSVLGFFFNAAAVHAQTLKTETGNNTSACSGVGDPAGLQAYCAGNFAGFNTKSANTNAETQIVDPIPGHVSAIKLINYLYSGAPTKFIAAYQPWFCTAGPAGPYNGTQTCTIASAGYHKIVGYDENNLVPKPGIIAAQDKLMIAEGFWAVSPDWYGTSSGQQFINNTVIAQAKDLSGRTLKLLVMVDGWAIADGTSSHAGCPKNSSSDQTNCITQVLDELLDYIDSTWAENSYYARDSSGANLVTFFLQEGDWPSPTNWTTIMDSVTAHIATYKTPMKLLSENNSFGSTGFSGAYAWPQPRQNGYNNTGTDGYTAAAIPSVAGDCSYGTAGCMQYYWNQTANPPGSSWQYLEDFYTGASTHSSDVAVGGIWKGFDDSNASWGTDRVIAQQCGQVLLDSFDAITWAHTSLNYAVEYAQVATWNDYEEGTEVETGVDNCYRVQNAAYSQSTNKLTWQLNPTSGNSSHVSLSTVHGYTVWKADSSGNLTSIASLGASATSLSNVSSLVGTGSWTLYVEMVGMPLIINRMSNGVTYP